MDKYLDDYILVVPSECKHSYKTAEYEAAQIKKCSFLQDEDVHYGEVKYSHNDSLAMRYSCNC